MILIICESLREIGGMACVTSAWSSGGQTHNTFLLTAENCTLQIQHKNHLLCVYHVLESLRPRVPESPRPHVPTSPRSPHVGTGTQDVGF